MNTVQTGHAEKRKGRGKEVRTCPFCYSADTMEPFRRSPHVAVLSRVLPRLRWRYCRSCTRHFLSFAKRLSSA